MKNMSFFTLLLASTLSATALPVRAETLSEKTGVNSTLGIAPTTADFVKEAAISDMFEIRSSQLPQAKGDPKLKAFADRMVADHTKTSSELKPLAEKAHVMVPEALDASHQKMLDELKDLKGEDFAKRYGSDQVSGHKDAISLFQRYSKGGEDAGLKAFAEKALPTIQDHEKMAENLPGASMMGSMSQ